MCRSAKVLRRGGDLGGQQSVVFNRQSAVCSSKKVEYFLRICQKKTFRSGNNNDSIHLCAISLPENWVMAYFIDLLAFKKAYKLAMEIFEISKKFPKEETYSLIDQVRRSSRSVCTNLAEAYRRRKYPAHFVSKIADSDAENAETHVWLDFAFDCKYITIEEHRVLSTQQQEVGKMIGDILKYPDKYL